MVEYTCLLLACHDLRSYVLIDHKLESIQKHYRNQLLLNFYRVLIKSFKTSSLFPRLLLPAMLSSPGAGLQNAISTVGPGQPSATAINSAATHIDPSSMQRAYAALGLPYGNQSPVQGQGPTQQNPQGSQHQQLRNMNTLGTG